MELEFPWGPVRLDIQLCIGRDPEFSPLAQQLNQYPNISRQHAEITITPQGLRLLDRGSSNGTFLNSRRLSPGEDAPIEIGSTLGFGRDLKARLIEKKS